MTKSEYDQLQKQLRARLNEIEFLELLETGRAPSYFDPELDDDRVVSLDGTQPDRLISLQELLSDYVPCSRTTLWRMVRARTFPPPMRIASRLRWRFSVIQKWIQEH